MRSRGGAISYVSTHAAGSVSHPRLPPSPNRLTGPVCAGCIDPQRCAAESLCWAGEKADIRAERLAR